MSFLSNIMKSIKSFNERSYEEIRIRKLLNEERLKKINKLKGKYNDKCRKR